MVKTLEPGVLYVSEEYSTAAHLCACGCGEKIRTPLGPTEWTLTQTSEGPSLYPSIGNWQQACRSHYWIIRGHIQWAGDWTRAQVEAGRRAEAARRTDYFIERGASAEHDGSIAPSRPQGIRVGRWFARAWGWLKRAFAYFRP